MAERDPRTDPRCGDVLTEHGLVFVVIHADTALVTVQRFRHTESRLRVTRDVWLREMADAEVWEVEE